MKRRTMVFLIIPFLLSSTIFAQSDVQSIDLATKFFPSNIFYPHDPKQDYSIRKWYSDHLSAMQEPSLLANSADNAFRFTWLRTFDQPISIRVRQNGSKYILNYVILDGKGGYEPGKVVNSTEFEIHKKQWDKIIHLAKLSSFFELQPKYCPIYKNSWIEISGDGAEWILEANYNNRYQVVTRNSPKQGYYRSLCMVFVRLSKIRIDQKDLY